MSFIFSSINDVASGTLSRRFQILFNAACRVCKPSHNPKCHNDISYT